MKPSKGYFVKVIGAGFIVLVLFSLPLFWGKFVCHAFLLKLLPHEDLRVSGILPSKIEDDPNIYGNSSAYASMYVNELQTLGIVDYIFKRLPGQNESYVYKLDLAVNTTSFYFDKQKGIFEFCNISAQDVPGKPLWKKEVISYIGPEGIAKTFDKNIGRFFDPIIDWNLNDTGIIYDKKLRQFFSFDFDKKLLNKGPQLASNDTHEPVSLGEYKTPNNVIKSIHSLDWRPPYFKETQDVNVTVGTGKEKRKVHIKAVTPLYSSKYIPVVDQTGRIDWLNKVTLQFEGIAGYLPAPQTLFAAAKNAKPSSLLEYGVRPIIYEKDGIHRGGILAVSISSEGTSMALAAFDEKGWRTAYDDTKIEDWPKGSMTKKLIPSSRAALWHSPFAPVFTISKYLLENLQPPILSIAAYFTADSFEAASGHRALFILPNSFVAMLGRNVSENPVTNFMLALLMISPSFILSVWLAFKVSRDAAVVGLSSNAQSYWFIGTILFGLPAYITYRLTRPKIVLVTCANCGRPRRPDMEKCHRCTSKWHVPELTPPSWRVLDT